MEIIDHVLWEQELAEHMGRYAGDLDGTPSAVSPWGSGAHPSFPVVVLWSVALLVVCALGWSLGWYAL